MLEDLPKVALRCLVLVVITNANGNAPLQFHEDLTREEQEHYFGKELTKYGTVPRYEFVSPQRLELRGSRQTGNDGANKLEYRIEAFGEPIHLLLEKNNHLVAPGCLVQHYHGNNTRSVVPCSAPDCFYTGRTSNNSESWAAASVCGGLHGMIGTGERTFAIQPIRDEHMSRARRNTRLENAHLIYQYQPSKRSCDSEHQGATASESTAQETTRNRRNAPRRYIETTVVADKTFSKFHGGKKESEKLIKIIMNIVAQLLLDPSLGDRLYLAVNRIVVLEEDEEDLEIVTDAGTTLNSFCAWASSDNPPEDSNPRHSDYMLLLTRTDLVSNGRIATSGLGRMKMCSQNESCSVNEDAGLGSAMTIAHEIGHALGMQHDGTNNQCALYVNMMSNVTASGPRAWKWSECSAKYLQQFLSSQDISCLTDAPPGNSTKAWESSTLPGTNFSADQQCKLMLGNTAALCPGRRGENKDVCGGITCRRPSGTDKGRCEVYTPSGTDKGRCDVYTTPRMDGTDCSDNSTSTKRAWCIGGQCVDMGPGSPAASDGDWSTWEPEVNTCSRTCGGGVRIVKRRFCNNPEPMYGGRDCEGSEVKGVLCNTQPCDTFQLDFPNHGATGDASCRGTNVDGSQCNMPSITPFSRCVKGKCRMFGCDGHTDSGLDFDKCGVCNGKSDTCRPVVGQFNTRTPYEFTNIVTIPAGATGITITQKNRFCYLSVIVRGQHLFAANSSHLSGTYTVGGVTIQYLKTPEKLHIVGPVGTEIVAQVYQKYGGPKYDPSTVEPEGDYEYYITDKPRSEQFTWNTEVGTCTATCGTGNGVPIITCEGPSGPVEDYHCDIHTKPQEVACPPRWRKAEWGGCSKTCGEAHQHRKVDCVQTNRHHDTVVSDQLCRSEFKPSTTSVCTTRPCPGVWRPTQWSACSASCARGVWTRAVNCYANQSSTTPIDDVKCTEKEKPADKEYCLVRPCRSDIYGDDCKDNATDCFEKYGDHICTNETYQRWALDNCMKSCGVCVKNPPAGVMITTTEPPECADAILTCATYGKRFCTKSGFGPWAIKYCPKFCGICDTRKKRHSMYLRPLPIDAPMRVQQVVEDVNDDSPVTSK